MRWKRDAWEAHGLQTTACLIHWGSDLQRVYGSHGKPEAPLPWSRLNFFPWSHTGLPLGFVVAKLCHAGCPNSAASLVGREGSAGALLQSPFPRKLYHSLKNLFERAQWDKMLKEGECWADAALALVLMALGNCTKTKRSCYQEKFSKVSTWFPLQCHESCSLIKIINKKPSSLIFSPINFNAINPEEEGDA